MARRSSSPAPAPEKEPVMTTVVYRGNNPDLVGTRWSVPLAVQNKAAFIESLAAEEAARQAADAEAAQRQQMVLQDRISQQQKADELTAVHERLDALESGAVVDYQQLAQTTTALTSSLAHASVLIESLRAGGEGSITAVERLQRALAEAKREAERIQRDSRQAQADRDQALKLAQSLAAMVSGSNERVAQLVTESEVNYTRATHQLNGLVEQLQEHDLQLQRAAAVAEGYEAALTSLKQEAGQQVQQAVQAGLGLIAAAMGLSDEDLKAAMARIELNPLSAPLVDAERLSVVSKATTARLESEAKTDRQSRLSTARAGQLGGPV